MSSNLVNKKSLPIIKKPLIRCYTYHAHLCCICESYVASDGMVADVDILNSNDIKDWNISTNNSRIHFDKNNIKVYNDKYDENIQVYMFRECSENDSIVMKINYQQYAYTWSTISIVVDNKPFKSEDSSRNFVFDYGNFSKTGLHVSLNEIITPINHKIKDEYPIYLKLEKQKNDYILSSSFDSYEWIDQGQYKLSTTNDNLFIGINISMNENQWYNWLFTNYIQLKCNPKSYYVHLDYYVSLSKNYKYHNLNMFLDYNTIDINFLLNSFKDIMDFIKLSINHNYYIELLLDEYYMYGYKSYQKEHRFHSNLIYGYDDQARICKTVGVEGGFLTFHDISYLDIDKAIKKCHELENIVMIKYNPDGNLYNLDLKRISRLLKDYLNSYNNSFDCSYIIPESPEIFGNKLYDIFIEPENSRVFLDDIRISYLISEHKIVMLERIKFLIHRKIIKKEDSNPILSQANELVKLSKTIMMCVIKNLVEEDLNLISRINEKMIEIKEKEIILYNKLISILDNY